MKASYYKLVLLIFFSSLSLFLRASDNPETSRRVWILGDMGAGKSTFLNVMLHHYFKGEGTRNVKVLDEKEPHAAMSSRLGAHFTQKPEIFTLKRNSDNITFVDLPIFNDKSQQKELAEITKLMQVDDTYFFLYESEILLRYPRFISNYLRAMYDFFPKEKLTQIISKFQFVGRLSNDQTLEKKEAFYHLLDYSVSLEENQKIGNYLDSELKLNPQEKDLDLASSFAKAVERKKIFLWWPGCLNKDSFREEIFTDWDEDGMTEKPLLELEEKAQELGVKNSTLEEKQRTDFEKTLEDIRTDIHLTAMGRNVFLQETKEGLEISSQEQSTLSDFSKKVAAQCWKRFVNYYADELSEKGFMKKALDENDFRLILKGPEGKKKEAVELLLLNSDLQLLPSA